MLTKSNQLAHSYRLATFFTKSKQILSNSNKLNLTFSKQNSIFSFKTVNVPFSVSLAPRRVFHTSTRRPAKIFVDRENLYAYKILQNISVIPDTEQNSFVSCEVDSESQLNDLLDRDWRSSNATQIVDAFKNALNYCILKSINLSDTRFDKLVDGLMDHVEYLTDEELADLLVCISKYPPCETIKSHNFHDVWSALDDCSCWKLGSWPIETALRFANLWFKLNLGKVSDYIFEMIDKFSRRPDRLTKDQLIHMFFYMNICRKRPVEFSYESALENIIKDMTVDEMAVCAMGFFKTQSKIKIPVILEYMIRKIMEDPKHIHEMSLCVLLKVIRFSNCFAVSNLMYDLLETLTPEIDRLSNLCCVHIAILGTNLQVFHRESIEKVAKKLVKDVENPEKLRLKDLERILLSLTMFDVNPNTDSDIFEAIFKEIHKDERLKEIVMHPRSLASTLLYLAMKKLYSNELLNRIMDDDFIVETFGKQPKLIPREIYALDKCIEIECPDYNGKRLDRIKNYKATKWIIEYIPKYDQHKKLTAADKLFLDVFDYVKLIVGNENKVLLRHILPHFVKGDMVICRDKATNQFVEPFGFENYELGDVMYPKNVEDFKWYAIVVVGWNATIRNGVEPLGVFKFKERHLNAIGYKPILVIWNEFMSLSKGKKISYILNKMNL